MDYPKGLDPLTSRQHLLHHTFSPLISLHATQNVDVIFQSITNNQNISTLQVFKPYGNNAKYSIPNQQYKILNTQLMTKNYASFPVRFEPSLPELLSILSALSGGSSSGSNNSGGKALNRLASSSSPTLSHSSLTDGGSAGGGSGGSGNGTPLNQLFSISSLETYLRHVAKDNGKDMYLTFFDKMITSNQITPFETFNHPVSQIFIIDYETDSIEELRKMIVNFRNFNFPKYFQIDDLMVHIFIIYDLGKFSSSEIISFSNDIKNKLNLNSTIFPMNYNSEETEEDKNIISLIENCTIEEDLQRITLNDSNDGFQINKNIDVIIRTKLCEYINKHLIPHMQAKIRLWDDQMLQPKRSIAGRFFLVSRKLFNSGNNSDTNLLNSNNPIKNGGNNPNSSFNYLENYYYKSASEQVLRKLADWSIMLKDFKYAYSTYELIRKDYSNDRAWVYVASTQEMCIVSLLLAQTQQNLNPTIKSPVPDKNTLRKIRHDIIDPYMDNLSYTFKSRLNLKTFSFRTMIIVVELLLCMSQIFHISYWWYEMIEKYLLKLSNDFDQHLAGVMSTYNYLIIKAILHERLGYNAGRSIFLLWENFPLLQENLANSIQEKASEEQVEEGMYVNTLKMPVPKNTTTIGCTRYRKSALWYLLAMKQWKLLSNMSQIKRLFGNIQLVYPENEQDTEVWYNRSDELLGIIKRSIE
ncbi:Trafficking protein particle complex III-specific subunit 85 [Candida viswanathii]|uniref:Trafficking protein particle complex III-specific subunit 85 n=1 Tax=Candida viswanathii TaxID=5486 RepID=A0A367YD39_9ASCO|nr:Trafficking protein particle complex III-specific subunit 85 [Candida viswanathii]